MKPGLLPLTLVLALCSFTVYSAPEGGDGKTDQDKQIAALTARVERLEALVGRNEHVSPAKPAMGDRLDRVERELKNRAPIVRPPGEDLRQSLRDFRQSLQETDRRVDALTARMDSRERKPLSGPSTTDWRSLQRDFDRLQRQIDELRRRPAKDP